MPRRQSGVEQLYSNRTMNDFSPPPELARRLQLALYRPETSERATLQMIAQARRLGVPAVSVFPAFVAAARAGAAGIEIVADCRQSALAKSTIKAIECSSAIKDGASAVQIEAMLAPQLSADFSATKRELLEIVRAGRATGRDVPIFSVVRSMALYRAGGESYVENACRAAREGACDGILDIGDDASHNLVRTHAGELLLSRCVPGSTVAQLQRLLQTHVHRLEIFMELLPEKLMERTEP